MADKMTREIPGYGNTSLTDSKNVKFLEYIFTQHHLKPFLQSDDKHPNLDGDVVILDENNKPFYKISTQIKTLPETDLDMPKSKIKLSIYDLADRHILPIIYIVVNSDKKIAYWKYIDKDEITGSPPSKKSEVFYFDKNNSISEKNKEYIEKWKSLYIERKVKIDKFDEVFLEKERLSKVVKEIQTENGAEQSEEFVQIHRFLDCLNNIYDTQFNDLKKFLYCDCWKFGFAYTNYTEDNVSFICFPIKYEFNQKQILKIDNVLVDDFLRRGLIFDSRCNIIQKNGFKELSKDVIQRDIEKCIKNRLFDIQNEFQATEILFYLIEEMKECLGLGDKEEYTFQEIYNGWFRYLPLWIDEVLKLRTVRINYDGSINLSFMKCQLTDEQLSEIDKKVKERIEKGALETKPFVITHTYLNLTLVVKSLEYLQRKGIKTIKRPYPTPQYPKKQGVSWVWGAYPKEIVREKINKIYKNLAVTYNSLLQNHFSQLFDKLNFFANFDKVIIHVQFEKETRCGEPNYAFYYLKSENENKTDSYYEIYFDDEFPYNKEDFQFRKTNEPTIIILSETKYQLISYGHGGNDFIYHETPVLELCYKILEDKFEKYFEDFNAHNS